jgi:hypothetical protein
MKKFLAENAKLVCAHELGRVVNVPTQRWVTIRHRPVLVKSDPAMRPILGCPNVGATIKPCQLTLDVQAGYSDFIFIDHKPVCLDTVSGLTDGTPPGTIKYKVNDPGQDLVGERT